MTEDEINAYLRSLKPGERVIETAASALWLQRGTVYLNTTGDICVMWDKDSDDVGQMGTSVTGGTRRLSDVQTYGAQSCPCCGSQRVYVGAADSVSYHARCLACGLRTRSFSLPARSSKPPTRIIYRLKRKAVEAWNRRPTAAAAIKARA